ncbi:MAG TPA: alpha/beta hydrolase [Prolixibacteraceae bacterium]|jgi:pimeloyl-ACP methyl ester carboxylesterase
MKTIFNVVILFFVLTSCQKERITIGTNVSETFYLDNGEATMRLLVEGNTASHTFLIFVHGGPGSGSFAYNTDYISQNIENKYAVVYWDQRNAGASQGNSNGDHLNLDQMTDDLKKVIQLIKSRYGQDSGIFILGHSFGGLLTASFMTKENNQSLVKGWIFADGSHNYPLNDSLTRQMLLTIGQQQIALKRNTDNWKVITDYCNAHTGNFTFEESNQLFAYATDAETYFEKVEKIDLATLLADDPIKNDWPITSLLLNMMYSSNASFNRDLAKTEFSSKLSVVTTPTLLLYGKYDFICPKGLEEDVFNRISTTDKKLVISPISGHNIMLQDEAFFCKEVNAFIESHK